MDTGVQAVQLTAMRAISNMAYDQALIIAPKTCLAEFV